MTLTVLSIVVAAAFLVLGATKIPMIPMATQTANRLGLADQQYRVIGVLEIIFAVLVVLGIWIAWMGSVGALMLTVVAAGAILAHARVADPPAAVIPASVLSILAFVLFLVHIYQ